MLCFGSTQGLESERRKEHMVVICPPSSDGAGVEADPLASTDQDDQGCTGLAGGHPSYSHTFYSVAKECQVCSNFFPVSRGLNTRTRRTRQRGNALKPYSASFGESTCDDLRIRTRTREDDVLLAPTPPRCRDCSAGGFDEPGTPHVQRVRQQLSTLTSTERYNLLRNLGWRAPL